MRESESCRRRRRRQQRWEKVLLTLSCKEAHINFFLSGRKQPLSPTQDNRSSRYASQDKWGPLSRQVRPLVDFENDSGEFAISPELPSYISRPFAENDFANYFIAKVRTLAVSSSLPLLPRTGVECDWLMRWSLLHTKDFLADL